MRYILCALIFDSYGEEWWKALIPCYADYTLATLVCSPMYFWIYIACGILGGIFYVMGLYPLAILAFIAMLVVYSIILFAVFVSNDEMKAKIPAIIIFVTDVLAPVLVVASAFISVLF